MGEREERAWISIQDEAMEQANREAKDRPEWRAREVIEQQRKRIAELEERGAYALRLTERLEAERDEAVALLRVLASCQRTIDESGHMDNYRDAARAEGRIATELRKARARYAGKGEG